VPDPAVGPRGVYYGAYDATCTGRAPGYQPRFALPGMTIEQDLGVAFGLVVRSMGAVKSIGAGSRRCARAR